MRTVEPLFKEGALERIMNPPSKEPRRDRTSIQPGALVPAGSTEIESYDTSVSQQIQHQGFSIDHISSSVNNLHDTMSELKHAFTTLRIELNGPNRYPSEMSNPPSSDFDMIATVLKELKSKSEEIERLKLEMEALKLKNRYMEKQTTKHPVSMAEIGGALPEVHSPGLLQGSRKRPWPDSFPSGRTEPIADSFDDDRDIFDDFTLADAPLQSVKVPLKDPEAIHAITDSTYEQTASEVNHQEQQTPRLDNRTGASNNNDSSQQHAIVKRPRVSQPVDRPTSSGGPENKRMGRPRKSISQATKPDFSHMPKQTPLSEQNVNISGGSQKDKSIPNSSPSENPPANVRRSSRSRSLLSRSRPPSVPPPNSRKTRHSDIDGNHPDQSSTATNGQELPMNEGAGSGKENPPSYTNGVHENTEKDELDEKRKTRDQMARLAMQREEAMETEEAR